MDVIFNVQAGITTMLIHCMLGAFATYEYSLFAASLYEVQWYNIPIMEQKYFIIMIAESQRPILFTGFGIVFLNLENFVVVRNNIICFFIVSSFLLPIIFFFDR